MLHESISGAPIHVVKLFRGKCISANGSTSQVVIQYESTRSANKWKRRALEQQPAIVDTPLWMSTFILHGNSNSKAKWPTMPRAFGAIHRDMISILSSWDYQSYLNRPTEFVCKHETQFIWIFREGIGCGHGLCLFVYKRINRIHQRICGFYANKMYVFDHRFFFRYLIGRSVIVSQYMRRTQSHNRDEAQARRFRHVHNLLGNKMDILPHLLENYSWWRGSEATLKYKMWVIFTLSHFKVAVHIYQFYCNRYGIVIANRECE